MLKDFKYVFELEVVEFNIVQAKLNVIGFLFQSTFI